MSKSEAPDTTPAETAAESQPTGMTLRELIDLVGPEFLDAELNVQLVDGEHEQRFAAQAVSVWARPRVFPGTAYPAQPLITLRVNPSQKIG